MFTTLWKSKRQFRCSYSKVKLFLPFIFFLISELAIAQIKDFKYSGLSLRACVSLADLSFNKINGFDVNEDYDIGLKYGMEVSTWFQIGKSYLSPHLSLGYFRYESQEEISTGATGPNPVLFYHTFNRVDIDFGVDYIYPLSNSLMLGLGTGISWREVIVDSRIDGSLLDPFIENLILRAVKDIRPINGYLRTTIAYKVLNNKEYTLLLNASLKYYTFNLTQGGVAFSDTFLNQRWIFYSTGFTFLLHRR